MITGNAEWKEQYITEPCADCCWRGMFDFMVQSHIMMWGIKHNTLHHRLTNYWLWTVHTMYNIIFSEQERLQVVTRIDLFLLKKIDE